MDNEIREFYDLETWKKAHIFVLRIYTVTKNFPKDELFGMTSQLRRAAASTTANIAEGFERYHFNDKIRFYYQARGSVAEVQSFLFLARDLDFIKNEECSTLVEDANQVRKLINGLIRSIEQKK